MFCIYVCVCLHIQVYSILLHDFALHYNLHCTFNYLLIYCTKAQFCDLITSNYLFVHLNPECTILSAQYQSVDGSI